MCGTRVFQSINSFWIKAGYIHISPEKWKHYSVFLSVSWYSKSWRNPDYFNAQNNKRNISCLILSSALCNSVSLKKGTHRCVHVFFPELRNEAQRSESSPAPCFIQSMCYWQAICRMSCLQRNLLKGTQGQINEVIWGWTKKSCQNVFGNPRFMC